MSEKWLLRANILVKKMLTKLLTKQLEINQFSFIMFSSNYETKVSGIERKKGEIFLSFWITVGT